MKTEKTCSKCKDSKELDRFYKNTCSTDGFGSVCKKCITDAAAEKKAKRNALYEYDPEKRISVWRDKVRYYGPWAPMMQTSETVYE